jgi:hypothetical protein
MSCLIEPDAAVASECPDYVNQRMYDALQQLNSTHGSGDRELMCEAVRRGISEAKTAMSVGCKDYSEVVKQYQPIADKNCKPYGY